MSKESYSVMVVTLYFGTLPEYRYTKAHYTKYVPIKCAIYRLEKMLGLYVIFMYLVFVN
jgi:hypothetical protein